MKKQTFLLLTMLSMLLGACSSDDDDDSAAKIAFEKTQNFPVSLRIEIGVSKPDATLDYERRAKEITEPRNESEKIGYKGILMYNDKDSHMHAYDMACPNCWNGTILKEKGYSYDCKVCGFWGDPEGGRGFLYDANGKRIRLPLVAYKVVMVEPKVYIVSNPDK